MKTTLIRSTLCATALAVAASGCADMNQTQRGTAGHSQTWPGWRSADDAGSGRTCE